MKAKEITLFHQPRIVSGMRPTGKLHIGHVWGALNNWKKLQSENKDCFYFVADYHALTSNYQHTSDLPRNISDMVLDWLAVGIDPEQSNLYLQSFVPEVAELFLLFSMITPVGWLERNPTFKEMRQEQTDQDLSNLGFLGYPVLQTADICVVKGSHVPVGLDQVPHLELSREIVRRLNATYGEHFPEPQALLTPSPKINGTDGRKMSKSFNNAIFLSDSALEIETKIKGMMTDPKRIKRQDPGNPKHCNLYPLHELYSSTQTQDEVQAGCVSAKIGCVDCKKMLLPSLTAALLPLSERRTKLASKSDNVHQILVEGSKKVQKIARETLGELKEKMHLHD